MELSEYLELKQHIDNIKIVNNNNNNEKEIDLNERITQAHQRMEEIEAIRGLEREIADFKQEKKAFEKEKVEFYKNIEKQVQEQIEKAITNGLNNAFK